MIAYKIHKEKLKYYIIPNSDRIIQGLPYPNNYLSFFFRSKAEEVLKAMNASWNEGYRYKNTYERNTND